MSRSSSRSPPHWADQHRDLIPGLPNDVAALILLFVPYSHHPRLKSTCKSWRQFFSSKTLISLRLSSPNARSHLLCFFPQDPTISPPYLFDPDSSAWCPLPPLPPNPYVYGLCNFAAVSVGPCLYVLGGSHFDARSFPLDRPSASASTFRFDFSTRRWDRLAPMNSPRGSFACTAVPWSDEILVAGGGSRHFVFGAAGSKTSSVERYDIARNKWIMLDNLPGFRAGCAGFLVRSEDRKEFWVMGGYGASRTIGGVFPVDEYYRDAVVLELSDDGGERWREVGNMWEEWERMSLGKVVVVEDEEFHVPGVFMLDKNEIFRYDMDANRWRKATTVPRMAPSDSSVGFVVLNGELYIMTSLQGVELPETRRPMQNSKAGTLFIQIYNPRSKVWRSLMTKPPFHNHLDFGTTVLCSIRL